MPTIETTTTDVCIVGAGPSGLACALKLAARKIPFVIVDGLEAGHNGSRAVLMHANALEALSTTHPQLADEIVAAGVRSKLILNVSNKGQRNFLIDIDAANRAYTKYAFCLLIPQHIVEAAMRKHLGDVIQWKKRVIAVEAVGQQYEVRFESGDVVKARYVVAADGSKSTVRQAAGIKYVHPQTGEESGPGPKDMSFVVADVVLQEPIPASVPTECLQLVAGGGVLTAPIPAAKGQKNLFRFYLGVPGTPPPAPDAAFIQAILDQRGPGSQWPEPAVPKIEQVIDSSRYRTRCALAERFFHRSPGGGYIILVGDAAHKHGPAGGQGMNLGICDGCEVAEAIGTHRQTAADSAEVFEEYSTRRRATAREVIEMVENMTNFEKGGDGWGHYLQTKMVSTMMKVPMFTGRIAWRLSGLGHAKKVAVAA
ncbi:FAD/NAD(P)-binding domain-containing protein [Mycena kentingensis (nom. inval.)]|nr:FAD/NAD(P)-binding domain-containing protein [Mycena kentingensis (nom. inval.)]